MSWREVVGFLKLQVENGGQVNVRVQQNHVARISYIDMIREYRQIN